MSAHLVERFRLAGDPSHPPSTRKDRADVGEVDAHATREQRHVEQRGDRVTEPLLGPLDGDDLRLAVHAVPGDDRERVSAYRSRRAPGPHLNVGLADRLGVGSVRAHRPEHARAEAIDRDEPDGRQ